MQNDCVNWSGYRDRLGYGHKTVNGKSRLRHRLEWENHYGEIPPGFVIMHSCDNRACHNIKHLRLGTQLDNIRDRDTKGRQRTVHGTDHKLAKLTEEDVANIRWAFAAGFAGLSDLASQYHVARSLIHRIIKRQSWSHI